MFPTFRLFSAPLTHSQGPHHMSHVPPPPPILRALAHSLLLAHFPSVFCRLFQSACSSFLPQSPLPSTCAHELSSSLDAILCHLCIPNQRTNCNANSFTFHGKMSRGGRGHSGSTTGSVKVPQLLPSPCQDTGSSVTQPAVSTASPPAQ